MLELKQIKKSYKTGDFTQIALNDVSINFRENEFVAILGTSGSGKTTLLNIIGGLDRYDEGDLVIKGKSTKKFKNKEWDAYRNNSVGFIFQSYNLIPHLNVLENVEMGMTLSGVKRTEKKKRSIEVLEKVGLKDHLHKKPNQLSGGQMQRVAIARALANDPEIILADEPTGSLDTTTSTQIMDLIKEIAKDKLVIMVTHNPELANDYANRIIQVRDGVVLEDSNPLESGGEGKEYGLKKTAMNVFTALHLSLKNIGTKKGRTLLTAFAASIGIIGIALILSLSNGFQKQIDKFQTDALSDFPILITPTTVSLTGKDAEALDGNKTSTAEKAKSDEGSTYDPADNVVRHRNILTEKYIDYVNKISPDDVTNIGYIRGAGLNIFKEIDGKWRQVKLSTGLTGSSGGSASVNGMQSMHGMKLPSYPESIGKNKQGYLEKNYDIVTGKYPVKSTDVVLIVDEQNRMDNTTAENLGLKPDDKKVDLGKIVGQTMRLVGNNAYYQRTPMDTYVPNQNLEEVVGSVGVQTLRISGVLRAKKDNKMAFLTNGICYSDRLVTDWIHQQMKSDIVEAQKNSNLNIMSLQKFSDGSEKQKFISYLGGDELPSAVMIYPRNFDKKEAVLKYLDKWNEGKKKDEKIIPTDLAQTITDLSGGIMGAITLVLIAFASISLVVSLIMVGIITYISVLERTKEIGVLRALGARKKDITRVFNAETFIIGLFSGLLGIGIAYLLTIPANLLIERATELKNVAQLNPVHAFFLVTISIILTLVGGMIPARMAAKKDPVVALRTE